MVKKNTDYKQPSERKELLGQTARNVSKTKP